MRLLKKISGLKLVAWNPTLIFCIFTFQNRFIIEAIFVGACMTVLLSIIVDGIDILDPPVTVFTKFQTLRGLSSSLA